MHSHNFMEVNVYQKTILTIKQNLNGSAVKVTAGKQDRILLEEVAGVRYVKIKRLLKRENCQSRRCAVSQKIEVENVFLKSILMLILN